MPRALRSAQRDKRFGYSALPLPKPLQPPRLPHGVIRGSQSRKVRTKGGAGGGGVELVGPVPGRGGSFRSGGGRFRWPRLISGVRRWNPPENCQKRRGSPGLTCNFGDPHPGQRNSTRETHETPEECKKSEVMLHLVGGYGRRVREGCDGRAQHRRGRDEDRRSRRRRFPA